MTVKELIKQLKKLDGEQQVQVLTTEGHTQEILHVCDNGSEVFIEAEDA